MALTWAVPGLFWAGDFFELFAEKFTKIYLNCHGYDLLLFSAHISYGKEKLSIFFHYFRRYTLAS